jgi:uncharacterized protein YbcV (DUF1398 family)
MMVIVGFFCGGLAGIGISYALYAYHMKTVETKYILSNLKDKDLLSIADSHNTERFSKSLQYVMSQIDTALYKSAKCGHRESCIDLSETGCYYLSKEEQLLIVDKVAHYLKDRGNFTVSIDTGYGYPFIHVKW